MDIVSAVEGDRSFRVSAELNADGDLLLELHDTAAAGERRTVPAAELPKLESALKARGVEGDVPSMLAKVFGSAGFAAWRDVLAFLDAAGVKLAPAVAEAPPTRSALAKKLTRYVVRNADGELTFNPIHELRHMFQQGLVDAADDVRTEGSDIWRKAGAIPELRALEGDKKGSGQFMFAAVTLCCLSGSLYALMHLHNFVIAGVLMVPVIGMSTRAFTKAMKRERS
jgi:hypothetical protein